MRMSRFAAIAGLGASLALSGAASAAVTVTDFNNFTTGSRYGSIGSGTVTSGANSLNVQTAGGFGGFHKDLPALSVNGTAENAIEFDVTVNSGPPLAFLAVLGDTDFTEWAYRFYASGPGQYTVTLPLMPIPNSVPNVGDSFISGNGGTPGLFFEDIDYVHIQIDSPAGTPINIDFNNLRLVTVPEPTSLAAAALASTILGRRKRR